MSTAKKRLTTALRALIILDVWDRLSVPTTQWGDRQ